VTTSVGTSVDHWCDPALKTRSSKASNQEGAKAMAKFNYDVVIIGSGFGGSVAALRAAEKGYSVAVLESGKRWPDKDIPKSQWHLPGFLWFPAAELYGIQRVEYLDDVLVLSGAGVGGGSHVYANTLYVPPKQFFNAEAWASITDWADELAPCFDQATRMLGVTRNPYMPTDVDRVMHQVANGMGRGETWNQAPVGVYFGEPGVEVDDPYFGGVGPRRTGCISCGKCNIGCGHNAKNKLTVNYLYLAEKHGAKVHELQEVFELVPLDGGGFEVHARHPGWVQRGAHHGHRVYTAEQVIVSAHAYGSAKLLLHMQAKGHLGGLSSQLGQRARTNSEQLLAISRKHGEWKADKAKISLTPGSVSITSGVWPDPVTSIEPVYWGVGNDLFSFLVTYHEHGPQEHPTEAWLKELVEHPSEIFTHADARNWAERTVIMLCSQTTDTSIELYWHDGLMRSRHSGKAPDVHIPIIEKFVDDMAAIMGGHEGALPFETFNRTASAHFTGGIPIGDSAETGAVDPYQRMFGQPGLHVIDGSVMPANTGVNPSLTITALAERAMSLWPNKGEADSRPPLGSGYQRVTPVAPHRPIVPAGALGELRLDAKKSDVIPDYPY
jgi:cholesterol oxidase